MSTQLKSRNRLCVKFQVDNNDHLQQQQLHSPPVETLASLNQNQQHLHPNNFNNGIEFHYNNNINANAQQLYLNPHQGTQRRHSSELKTSNNKQFIPKANIIRTNSDTILNAIGKDDVDDSDDLDGDSKKKKFENKRTNAALKKLASYINVKPRLKYKEHNFQGMAKMLNIKSNKCRICSETIFFQCYECIQCKLIGHKKCLQKLYVKCPNKLMQPRLAVFGLNISDDNNHISEVLSTCIIEIEKRPIHKLRGIYKIEGNRNIAENLCLSFEFGAHLIDLSQISPYDIAEVIKEYLLRISTPIFNCSLQKELITIGREWPVRKVPYTSSGIAILVFELRRLIGTLQPAYRNNLAYLIYHLKRIVDRQNITEMTANSLAIVFAPIIFRDESSKNHHDKIYTDDIYHKHHRKSSSSSSSTTATASSPASINSNGVHILLDVTLKIRVIELMIHYVNDIFANLP